MLEHIIQWDAQKREDLASIWMCGDVHGEFRPLENAIEHYWRTPPKWIIFLGDLDLNGPLDEYLYPIRRLLGNVHFGYIPGNHDSDNENKYESLTDSSPLNLHGKVMVLEGTGVSVAGLGGIFLGKVWYPLDVAKFDSYDAATMQSVRTKQRPNPSLLTAIYPNDYERLCDLQADILISHEAGESHPHGFVAIDDLARQMQVKRTFHGHHHDNLTAQYRTTINERGFDAVGVTFRGITNGLGEVLYEPKPKGIV